MVHLRELLADEHALRRLSGIAEAGPLQIMFNAARLFAARLDNAASRQQLLQELIASLKINVGQIDVALVEDAFRHTGCERWSWSIPLPARKPFREAKLRMDSGAQALPLDNNLLALLADAHAAREMVLANPLLGLNQLAKQEGRCRTQLARLLRIAWLSPKIVDAIASGNQPRKVTRQALLSASVPVEWAQQEQLFGFAG